MGHGRGHDGKGGYGVVVVVDLTDLSIFSATSLSLCLIGFAPAILLAQV